MLPFARALRHRFRRRDVERLGAGDGRHPNDARRRTRPRLWGIATSVPNIVAPLVGGWLIGRFGGTRAGYQAVFGLAGFSFALASVSVLRVGQRPLSSLWGWPVRFAAITSNYVWDHLAYRVRSWGRLPRRRGATLLIANHQHDFESPAIVSTTTVQ